MKGELPGKSTGRLQYKSPLALIIDGVNIDELLSDTTGHFYTSKVKGRTIPEFSLNTKDVTGRDGALYLDKHLSPRNITVYAYVDDIDNVKLVNRLARLNKILRSDYVKVKFNDDLTNNFYCTFVGMEVPEDTNNDTEIAINFYAADPFKYKDSVTLNVANSAVLNLDTRFPVPPVIELTFSSSPTDITIQNVQTGQVIQYKYLSGTKDNLFKFDVKNGTLTSTILNHNQISGLVLKSDWEDFTIDNGQQLVVTPAPSTMKVTYEGADL